MQENLSHVEMEDYALQYAVSMCLNDLPETVSVIDLCLKIDISTYHKTSQQRREFNLNKQRI